jgi:hypothetical protein
MAPTHGLAAIALATLAVAPHPTVAAPKAPVKSFVQRTGSNFTVDGQNYRFAGTNCYYLQVSCPLLGAALQHWRCPTRFGELQPVKRARTHA